MDRVSGAQTTYIHETLHHKRWHKKLLHMEDQLLQCTSAGCTYYSANAEWIHPLFCLQNKNYVIQFQLNCYTNHHQYQLAKKHIVSHTHNHVTATLLTTSVQPALGSISSSNRNEYYLGGIIALLLQDHCTMLLKSVCSSRYMVTDPHKTIDELIEHGTLSGRIRE